MTPSTSNNNDAAQNAATTTTNGMVVCPDCGKEVPELNLTLHSINACDGRARMAASSSSKADDAGSEATPMEVDENQDNNTETKKQAATTHPNNRTGSPSSDDQDMNHTSTTGIRKRRGKRRSRPSDDNDEDERKMGSHDQDDVVDLLGGFSGNEVVDLTTRRRNRSTTPAAAPPDPNNVVDLVGGLDSGSDVVDLASLEPNNSTASGVARLPPASSNSNSNDDDQWACPQCTLLNPKFREACDACHFRNPDRPPDATRREQLIPDDYGNNGMSYVGHGALLGGVIGAAGSYMRGRDMFAGAAEGAMTGGLGGVILNEVMNGSSSAGGQGNNNNNNSNNVMGGNGFGSSLLMNNVLDVTSTASENYNPNLAQARSSAALGSPSYPSFASREETMNRTARPRSSYRVTQRLGDDGTTTTFIQGGNGSSTTVRTRHSISSFGGGGGHQAAGNPMLSMLLHDLYQQQGRGSFGGGGGRHGGRHDVDGMGYEQLLSAFGDGTENMGAEESQISRLPTRQLVNPEKELPEDARQCLICLEDFEKDEIRITMPCLHGFHKQCAEKWLRTNGSCPICKHRIE